MAQVNASLYVAPVNSEIYGKYKYLVLLSRVSVIILPGGFIKRQKLVLILCLLIVKAVVSFKATSFEGITVHFLVIIVAYKGVKYSII